MLLSMAVTYMLTDLHIEIFAGHQQSMLKVQLDRRFINSNWLEKTKGEKRPKNFVHHFGVVEPFLVAIDRKVKGVGLLVHVLFQREYTGF